MKKGKKKSTDISIGRKWFLVGFYFGALLFFFLVIDSKTHSISDTLINFFPAAVGVTLVFLFLRHFSK